jgi:predicted GH43/DUF377 family glycosyl hydrolase
VSKSYLEGFQTVKQCTAGEFVRTHDVGLKLIRQPPLSEMYVLSPFVWKTRDGYEMLVRAVNHSSIPANKVARIYAGRSDDGLHFEMGDGPVIPPGPDEADRDGAEDPTVVAVGDTLHVYYTGWNQAEQTAQLMLAVGPNVCHLRKCGVVLPSTPDHRNTKEATLARVPDGSWRLFFEYSLGGKSRIGLAAGPSFDGPWTNLPPLFEARSDKWDSWHLSTGPILYLDPDRPFMFYNGADKGACWKIGWIAFDAGYTRVVARTDEPLIVPRPVEAPYRDIAFANSLVEHEDEIWLYYSVADMDVRRATLARSNE